MSLEAAISENTKHLMILIESVNKQNDLAERMIGLKTEAIETVKQMAAKPETAPTKATKAAAAETKVEEPKPEPEKVAEAPMDPIAQAISDYVATGYDLADPKAADERKARGAKVKEIFAVIAKKAEVEVKKHSDIPEKFHGPFLKTLAARAAEGCLVIGKASAEEDDLMGA